MLTTFVGAQVYLPDQIAETNVTVLDGRIEAIDDTSGFGKIIDARGKILAPAMIDVHGDAFERQLMPRPGVMFPIETALLETDRQLAANGIATAYHAVTLSYEPGLRSVSNGQSIIDALSGLAPRMTVENRVQLRWETFAFEALELLDRAIAAPLAPSLAFNDHLSMMMRARNVSIQKRGFEHSPHFAIMDIEDDALHEARQRQHAERSGLDWMDHIQLVKAVWARRPDVPKTLAKVAAKSAAHGVPMLSHDDTDHATRSFFHGLGVKVAEFPMTRAAVEAARSNGDLIVLGAPNAVRGGSHIGSLSAGDMVEEGLCDALASDYFYPAMLAAIDRLHREKRADRLSLWSLVSSGPARAMKLSDRGQIALGKRADLVLLDWPEDQVPAVRGTWVAGREAYQAQTAQ